MLAAIAPIVGSARVASAGEIVRALDIELTLTDFDDGPSSNEKAAWPVVGMSGLRPVWGAG